MAVLRCIFVLLTLQRLVASLVIRRKTEDFPLHDCQTSNIDLMFLADAGTFNPETVGTLYYRNQMRFFSHLVDVFVPPSETQLNRVKISLLASTVVGNGPSNYRHKINKRFAFNSYKTRDTLKSAIENDSVDPVPVTFPLSAALYAMQEAFNETGSGVRSDSHHILVMVVNGAKSLQMNMNDDLQAFNSTTVKLLVVLVGSQSEALIMSIFPSNNLVEVTSFEDLMQNQMIPIMLCLSCHSNWFRFKAVRDADTIANISCYRVFTKPMNINWIQAVEQCISYESELVSIETKEEMSFLRETLPAKIYEITNGTGDSNGSIDVFIGLKRNMDSYAQRFQWLNDLPLAYTAWEGGEPLGGHIQGCTAWNFNVTNNFDPAGADSISSAWSVMMNETEYQSATDAWVSIGCGHKKSQYFLCESKKPQSFREGRMPSLSKTSDKKTRDAVARGELGLRYEDTELYGQIKVLVATSSVTRQTGDQGNFAVIKNHIYEETMSSSDLIMFDCGDVAHTRIPYALVCDFIPQCQNKRDETVCNYRKCDSLTEFTCKSGQCIPLDAECDLFPDCVDQSDEEKCVKCRNGLCHDGRCLPKHWFADGEVDCNACTSRGNVKAEMASVPDDNISQCAFTCNRTQCTYVSMLGDGVVDCTGPEGPLDEILGALESTTCYDKPDNISNIYNNWAPRCVYYKDRYDGLLGCRDLGHLQNCENFICPEGYMKCPRSYCIPIQYVSNGVYECPNGEDETIPLNCDGNFRCYGSEMCLHPDNVCDKHPHCPMADDELNCGVSCKDGFQCLTSVVTVTDYDLSVPLTDLSFVDPRTRYLDLSGVNISTVFPEHPTGLFHNLLELHLSNCGITHVDRASYSQNDLWSVITVDLSMNQIQSIAATSIFRYMVSLQFLNLSRNQYLGNMNPDALNTFGMPSQLIELDLSYTNMTVLPSSLLVPLVNLKKLSLRGTKIVDLVPTMFPEDFVLQVLDLREINVMHFYEDTFRYLTIRSNMYTDTFKLCCPQLHNPETPSYVCQAPPDPFSSCSDLVGQEILRALLWIFGCFAIVGNVVVIIYRLVWDRNILKMAYGQFVMHLSISDLFMGVYLLIVASADSHFRGTYVWNEMEWRNSVACRVGGFNATLSSEVSTFFIFLITVDRFLVIKFPFGNIKMNKPLITFCCAVAWAVGIIIALIPVLPPFEYWSTYTSNGMCLGLPLINRRQPGWEVSHHCLHLRQLLPFYHDRHWPAHHLQDHGQHAIEPRGFDQCQ